MKTKLSLSVFLICCALTFSCAGRTPSSAVKGFYEAVAKGDSDAAIRFLSRQTIDMIGKDKLKAGIQEASRKILSQGGLTEVRINSESIAGDVATLSATLKYGNGTEEIEQLNLVKEGSGWKIQPEK